MEEKQASQIFELSKILINSYFSLLSASGLTEEQLEERFQKEKIEFFKRKIEDLPKPPK